jgi:trimeric autotransporter adhesin
MATWKKVAVSGSDISQFNNDAGYVTSITAQNAFATASYDGTLLLADDANGNLTFASSSDQGLTISANAGTDTLTFGLSTIPNTSLANSTISGKALGTNLDDLTVDNATLQLDSGTTYNGSAAKTISVKDGGIDTAAIATSLGTIGTNSFTGSFSGSFVGTADLPDLTDGNGIADFTYDGSTTATISVESDTTTGGNVVGVSVTANGVGINVDNIDGTGLSASGGGLLDVDYGSTSGTTVQGNTTITLTQTAGEIDITGTAAQALGGGPSYTIGLADTISGNRTFSGDTITINNDLIVQGTASFQNTTNLEVSDRFRIICFGFNRSRRWWYCSTTSNSRCWRTIRI